MNGSECSGRNRCTPMTVQIVRRTNSNRDIAGARMWKVTLIRKLLRVFDDKNLTKGSAMDASTCASNNGGELR